MRSLLFKVALFLAYSVFAGYSAWMTATSVQLKWMSQMPIWFVFIMIFIIALFAGWCLDNAIKQLKNPINPSKTRFFLNLIGFLVFWTFSFMTNVHYNVIQEYGESNLSAQLADCKRYLIANSDEALAKVEAERSAALKDFEDKIFVLRKKFVDELLNEQGGGILYGFGPNAKTILKELEEVIKKSSKTYDDSFDYNNALYKSPDDDAYSRYHGRKEVNEIVIPHFTDRIDRAEEKHKKAIVAFYQKKISIIKDNKGHLNTVAQYEKMLEKLTKDNNGNYSEYFKFYKSMDKYLLSKVAGYKESNIKYQKDKDGNEIVDKKGNKIFDGYKIYPSDRMFNFWDVWKDWFKGYLPEHISLVGQFIWSIIVDVIAFILICLIF